jgi:hypothetical protein
VAKPTKHGDKWRIRWVDERGKRQSAVFDDYRRAQTELSRHQVEVVVGGYCDTDYWTVNEPPFNEPMGNCDSDWDWELCKNDWWNGIYAQTSNTWYYYVNSCAKIGSHTLSALWRGRYGGQWTVPEESGRWYRAVGNCGLLSCDNGTARSDVLDASGREFDFRHEIYYE